MFVLSKTIARGSGQSMLAIDKAAVSCALVGGCCTNSYCSPCFIALSSINFVGQVPCVVISGRGENSLCNFGRCNE